MTNKQRQQVEGNSNDNGHNKQHKAGSKVCLTVYAISVLPSEDHKKFCHYNNKQQQQQQLLITVPAAIIPNSWAKLVLPLLVLPLLYSLPLLMKLSK